ncbi:MAG TPA: pyruvate, phosphate dikinase, partial [Candidatus Limnocylindrales bacterium]|nr:pyruvate, phosphate dikinase [Candidatus Limnocylindrales bacterium]
MAQATDTALERPHVAAKRYIYAWGGGTAEGNGTMKDLLGGKGAGLAEMTLAGLPTPPGFTITTEACNDYFENGKQLPPGLWDDVLGAMKEVEERSGKGFGDPRNPLLVSVRSGAKFSMPGMMDTVLNLGLNEETLAGLIELSGNERFGWDAYRRFIGMFGRIVMDVKAERFDEPLEARKHAHGADAKDTDLTVEDLQALVVEFKKVVREDTGREFPTDVYEQLDLAVKAVFASWFGKRANDYRTSQKIAHDLGTAVNVMSMVFGNMGNDSGTGVAFTRNTFDGTKELYGEYLVNAQGEDVVAGIRTPEPISQLKDEMPEAYEEFVRIGNQLEAHYKDVQDLEFTIERGKLYMLQTRIAKRTAAAAVKIAVQMVNEGVIGKREAVERIEPAQVDQLLRAQFDPAAIKAAPQVAKGLNASPGAAVGRAVFDADIAVEWVEKGEKVVLVRVETSPDDFHGMAVAQGILTARGGATSHAAVVARQIGKPCVAGCAELVVDYGTKSAKSSLTGTSFAEGDWISVDGSTGVVYVGALPTVEARFEDQPELQTILGWADEIRRMGVWANADTPEQATKARSYGAAGIGLCRTEHMFMEGGRLPIVQSAILVAGVATRAKAKAAAGEALSADEQAAVAQFDEAMGKLEALQQGDFEGIFQAMDGLPVVIRLIDPPLHEFLPNLEEQLVKVTRAEMSGGASEEDKVLLATIKSMHEQNPMLGLRGCRLGIMIPDFVKIQTRAILNAQVAVRKAGGNPIAKIMIPLVGHVNELRVTRAMLEVEADAIAKAAGVDLDYKFGTMIEIPRGALTADEIATEASFFSFGTNDLTQMTFGYSR